MIEQVVTGDDKPVTVYFLKRLGKDFMLVLKVKRLPQPS
jgi:hypothetical protein